eukprot:CAMPEP_0171588038 /NCGR_PEP_ID=MMETSP0961-20121227/13808_1 /TAXON_ID=87120 /ORGANISM="Aurantiochytrium limacinum, Strain ATCCMYA-1381" /LENGTH=879 /DNA_ID=CAMNT_0012146655 /DNA_START=326 /DNA_END=2965 /DNA_ORIENTATION=+
MDEARSRTAQGSRPPAEALREKWIGFLEAMTLGRSKGYDMDTTAYVFQLMLRMYAHKVVVHELEALYSYRPERFIFFVPQFVNFALHGAQDSNVEALEEFLLDKSANSLRFAHRLFWFVRSFSPSDVNGKLMEKAEAHALMACESLSPVAGLATVDGVFGESAAGLLATLDEKATTITSPNGSFRFELVKPLPRLAQGPPHVLGVSEFRWAVAFFDELTHMGGTLSAAPEPTRNRQLRATLNSLQSDFLPSDVMYLPIGKRPSRVVGVVSSESFCFKTNTRVPYLVCLEVVDDPGSYDDDIDEYEHLKQNKDLLRRDSSDLGGRIKETLGEWKNKLARHISTSSQHMGSGGIMLKTFSRVENADDYQRAADTPETADDIVNPIHAEGTSHFEQMDDINVSGEHSKLGSGAGLEDDDALGQWTPKEVPAGDLPGGGRGAGFSHFVHHQDYDFEDQRDFARERLAQQHSRSPRASLGSSVDGYFVDVDLQSDTMGKKYTPARSRSFMSEDSFARAIDEYHGGSLKDAPDAILPDTESAADADAKTVDDINGDLTEITIQENGMNNDLVNEADDEDDEEDEGIAPAQTVIFRERWADKTKRIAAQSRWSHLPNWRIVPIIVKSDDDLRQEQFAAQLIALFDSIFREDRLPLRLHPYDVLAVSPDSGLIQAVPDTISLDSLKKNDTDYTTLRNFFIRYFGRPKSSSFKRAQSNFCESLAAYCIVCYLLQIKDRHNGNLLLNAEGHIVHIDFGFLLTSQGPGNMNFERDVPFKITSEFVQLLDGPDSALFRRFRTLCCKAFLAARQRREQFILMIEMMLSNDADLDCFQAGGEETIRQLNERFQVGKSTAACISFVNDLIDVSINHYRTWLYDVYQRLAVGIKY